ncbi:uncharacterized protein LOC120623448 [Pararge aegeria]|uniref:uncharacterized protein LOC120623448 n=1 Tax=Pararge aegeria TaxID=116150 RepID=UPI0019D1AF37|nr:uncharacterized protein LOC120623448 [Pararge aegeria]
MIIIYIVIFFVSRPSVGANNSLAKDNILCRDCGTQILSSDTIISKSSAASLYSFNDTIFNDKEVLVQLLVRDLFLQYPIITSSESTCLGKGDWDDDELWFPNHVMKPCFCPECGAFSGWMFKNDSPTTAQSMNQFFGIILTNVIGENFLNSLITFPKV